MFSVRGSIDGREEEAIVALRLALGGDLTLLSTSPAGDPAVTHTGGSDERFWHAVHELRATGHTEIHVVSTRRFGPLKLEVDFRLPEDVDLEEPDPQLVRLNELRIGWVIVRLFGRRVMRVSVRTTLPPA